MAPRTPLFRPDRYYERFAPSLEIAILAVTANAVGLVVLFWWFLNEIAARTDVSPSAMETTIGDAVPLVLVSVFIGWFLTAGVLHLFVIFGGGEGFLRTLTAVGEAELASVATLPLLFGAFYLLLGDIPSDPEAAAAFFRRSTSRSQAPLLALTALTTAWRTVILGYGIAAAYGIARRDAFKLAGIYAGINLVFVLA